MPNIFARTEKKYLLTKKQYETLVELLKDELMEEKYHRYKICNIYYDTDKYDLFRLSNEKPIYKEKLRLRSYGTPKQEDLVFLEIKKKYNGIVYKRRIDLPLNKAYNFISDKNNLFDESINAKEIKYLLKRYSLKPKVYLSYNRETWIWKNDLDFRITFDTNIKYRLNEVDLIKGDFGEYVLNDEMVLMELKSINNLPIEFVKVLSKIEAYPISFSKIGTVYKNIILPQLNMKDKKERNTKLCQQY